MKIAVCDDDKAAREHIVSLIKKETENAQIMTFSTGEEMLKVILHTKTGILESYGKIQEMEQMTGSL